MSQLIECLIVLVSHRGWTVVLFNLFESLLFSSLDSPVDFTRHLVLFKFGSLVVRWRTHAISDSLLQKASTLLLQLETARWLALQLLVISARLWLLFIPFGLFSESGDTVELVDRVFLFGKEVATRLVLTGSGEVFQVLDEFSHDVSLSRLHDFKARILLENKRIEFDELVALDAPVICVSIR